MVSTMAYIEMPTTIIDELRSSSGSHLSYWKGYMDFISKFISLLKVLSLLTF